MKPDIYVKLRFRTTAEGGRKTSIIGDFYACPLIIDGEAYDCRLLIKNIELKLGQFYEVPIKFLSRDLALPNLSIEKHVTLWEGREVADGEITQICS